MINKYAIVIAIPAVVSAVAVSSSRAAMVVWGSHIVGVFAALMCGAAVAGAAALYVRRRYDYGDSEVKTVTSEVWQAIAEMTLGVSPEEDVYEGTLKELMGALRKIVGAHGSGVLYLYDNYLYNVIDCGYDSDNYVCVRELPDTIGIVGRTARTGEVQWADHVVSDKDYMVEDPAVISSVTVPLKCAGKTVGVLNFDFDRYTPRDDTLLEALGPLLAIMGTLIGSYVSKRIISDGDAIWRNLNRMSEQEEVDICYEMQCGIASPMRQMAEACGVAVVILKGGVPTILGFDGYGTIYGTGSEVLGISGSAAERALGSSSPEWDFFEGDAHVIKEAAMPLLCEGKTIGVLIISYNKDTMYVQESVEVIEPICSGLAACLASNMSREELLKRQRIWSGLMEVTAIASVEGQFREGVQHMVSVIKSTMGIYGVVVGTVEKNVLSAVAVAGYDDINSTWTVPLDGSLLGRVIKTKQMEWVEDLASDEDYTVIKESAAKSVVNIPLITANQLVGVLSVSFDKTTPQDDEFLATLRPVAATLASFIGTRVTAIEASRRERIWNSLLDISRSVTTAVDFNLEIRRIASSIKDIMGACCVNIWILSGDKSTINSLACVGGDIERSRSVANSPATDPGRALHSGSIVWFEDIRYCAEPCNLPDGGLYRICVPLICANNPIGVIAINFTSPQTQSDEISATLQPVASSLASFIANWRFGNETRASYQYLIRKFLEVAGGYHLETDAHLGRVSKYCAAIADYQGRSRQDQENIALFSQIHDIGKIRIPLDILQKEGDLSDDERHIVEKHPQWGAELIGNASWLSMARNICLYHHERWDGSGYPLGLKGSDIPWEARITQMADVYDTLRSTTAYRKGYDHTGAIDAILYGDGYTMPSHFDPSILEFIRNHHEEMKAIYQS